MATRRSFLGTMAGGAAAAAVHGSTREGGAGRVPLGLQLWSVRAMLEKDVPGTLEQVRDWGFDEVETFSPFGAETATGLKKAGLRCRAMHIGYDRLEKDLAGVLKDADAVGATTIVNPYLPHQARPYATRKEILTAAASFARWSKACRAAGKRFGYHIHGQEFGPAPEGSLFDVLAKEAGSDVGFEVDVYWVTFGGGDPVGLIDKYAGRVWFTHLKDMAKGTRPGAEAAHDPLANVVLGSGQIDVEGVVRAAAKAAVEIHYLEDESLDPAGQIPRSVAFFRSL